MSYRILHDIIKRVIFFSLLLGKMTTQGNWWLLGFFFYIVEVSSHEHKVNCVTERISLTCSKLISGHRKLKLPHSEMNM